MEGFLFNTKEAKLLIINWKGEKKKEKESKKQIRGKGEIADFFFFFF